MHPSQTDVDEVLRQSARRAKDIAALENRLAAQRELRAVDARWLLRNTDLSRSSIAGVLGISRVTLNEYLKDGGMDDAYIAAVRELQKKQGVTLYSPDISRYLDTAEQE